MQDADGDGRADRVGLVYSERVRHAADKDGAYPFLVAGYKIRAVGAANGNTVVLTLAEKAAVDAAARPSVRYGRTKADSILDRARNQALAQVFRATRAHGNKPRVIPPPPPPVPAPGDRDGDGVVDPQDCAPADPKIRPDAPDAPDLAFVDSNCDGIDGDEKRAVFASPLGKDTNPGTKAAPKREIAAAVVTAAIADKDVYAAAGDYKPGRGGPVASASTAATTPRPGIALSTKSRRSPARRKASTRPAPPASCSSISPFAARPRAGRVPVRTASGS
jgi:hypothetical protein